MSRRLIDITPPITPALAVWPGDVPFARTVNLDITSGDTITLSSIASTVHLGAHADAPNHYEASGEGIEACALAAYYGLCQVVSIALPRHERIMPEHLPAGPFAPRVLLRTGSFPDPSDFNEDFNSLSPELIDWLADEGVVLIGIDTPSVDPFSDKTLASHHALARRGVLNLEGLVLKDVTDGRYTLIALPLKIVGADASPVRAVLVQGEG
ncbi:MAG: cyclase family protein [Planctomycetota bacterium]|jgi:arylformamidase